MYTQFHLDTRPGRIVSHRLADESLGAFEIGSVALALDAGARVSAGDAAARGRLALQTRRAPLGNPPADLGGHDDDQRDRDHDHRHGNHLR